MESLARGGTRWKRFAVVMVPSVAATAAIGVALAQGALAASFSVSGQQFKVTADRLDGTGSFSTERIDTHEGAARHAPVAVSAFKIAKITNLCQSVVMPVPVFGDVTLKLKARAAGGTPVEAKNLYIDARRARRRRDVQEHRHRRRRRTTTTKGPGPNKGDKYRPGLVRPAGRLGDADRRQADGVGDHRRHVQAQRPEDGACTRARASASDGRSRTRGLGGLRSGRSLLPVPVRSAPPHAQLCASPEELFDMSAETRPGLTTGFGQKRQFVPRLARTAAVLGRPADAARRHPDHVLPVREPHARHR